MHWAQTILTSRGVSSPHVSSQYKLTSYPAGKSYASHTSQYVRCHDGHHPNIYKIHNSPYSPVYNTQYKHTLIITNQFFITMISKKRIYVLILALIAFFSFVGSLVLWLFSQTHLQAIAQENPDAIVPAGSSPFLFAVITYILLNAITYGYITTWRVHPQCCNEYSKSELVLLSMVTFVLVIANFSILNLSWQYAFVGVALIIYEIITGIPCYKHLFKYYNS